MLLNALTGFGAGAQASDGGNDAFTKLLLHCDGTNGSTTFTDSSSSAHTVTSVGNAQISTSQLKFGSASALFDGAGDYLTLDGSSDFAFGTGDFTIDFWLRLTSAGTYVLYDQRPSGTEGLYPTIYTASGVLGYLTNSTIRITGTTSLSTATWYHIALIRSGTSTKLFLNGTQEGSTYTDSNNYIVNASRPVIGAHASTEGTQSLNGNIDEIRVSKGIARDVTTPPTAPYS